MYKVKAVIRNIAISETPGPGKLRHPQVSYFRYNIQQMGVYLKSKILACVQGQGNNYGEGATVSVE